MASRKFGRKPGFGNYRADVLLDIVEIVKPKGLSAWNEVAEQYMKLTGESGLRSAEDMKRHFNQSLCNSGKKPNDNETSAKAAVIERAQAIYATIRKDRHSSSHKNFEQISSHLSGRAAASSKIGFGVEDPSIPVDLEQEHEHDTENESISSGDDSGRHSGRNTFDERHSGNIESLASAAAAVELAGLEMGMGMGMTTAGMKRSLESVSPINLSGINNNSSNNSSNKHSRVSTTSGRVDTRGRGSSVDSDDLSASSFSAYPRGAYQQQQQQQQALEGNQFTHRSSTARTSSNASGPTMNSLAGAAAVHHHQQQSQRIAALETRLTSVEQLLKREAEGRQQDRLEFERLLREHQRVEDIRRKEERLEYERLRLEERRQEDERMRLERAEAERVRNEERRLDEARRREERNEAERVRKEDQQRMQLLVLTLLKANGSGSGNGNGNGSSSNHILDLFTDGGITSTSGTGSGGMSTSATALTSTSNTSSPSE